MGQLRNDFVCGVGIDLQCLAKRTDGRKRVTRSELTRHHSLLGGERGLFVNRNARLKCQAEWDHNCSTTYSTRRCPCLARTLPGGAGRSRDQSREVHFPNERDTAILEAEQWLPLGALTDSVPHIKSREFRRYWVVGCMSEISPFCNCSGSLGGLKSFMLKMRHG